MCILLTLNKVYDNNEYFYSFRDEETCGCTLTEKPNDVAFQQLRLPRLFPKWPDKLSNLHLTYHEDVENDFPVAKKRFFILAAKYLADMAAVQSGIRSTKAFNPDQVMLDTSALKITELAEHIYTSLYDRRTSSTEPPTDISEADGYETDCQQEALKHRIKTITPLENFTPAFTGWIDLPREKTLDPGYVADDEEGISSGDDEIPNTPDCQLLTKALRPTPFIVLDETAQRTLRNKDSVLNELLLRFESRMF